MRCGDWDLENLELSRKFFQLKLITHTEQVGDVTGRYVGTYQRKINTEAHTLVEQSGEFSDLKNMRT